jgi:DNA-directed RNA polymerase subunit RPC12/RpoP
MEGKRMPDAHKVNLRVSVEEYHRGLKNLDFFADHTASNEDMRFMPDKVSAEMGPLYLRTALTTIACPLCNHKVKRNIRHHPVEWLLKFVGRNILYCTGCGWKEIVKESRWEWETIATAFAAFLIVCFASIHWIIR